jgi:hypothetical protein
VASLVRKGGTEIYFRDFMSVLPDNLGYYGERYTEVSAFSVRITNPIACCRFRVINPDWAVAFGGIHLLVDFDALRLVGYSSFSAPSRSNSVVQLSLEGFPI